MRACVHERSGCVDILLHTALYAFVGPACHDVIPFYYALKLVVLAVLCCFPCLVQSFPCPLSVLLVMHLSVLLLAVTYVTLTPAAQLLRSRRRKLSLIHDCCR